MMTDLLTRIITCDGSPQATAELILEAWLADNPEPKPRRIYSGTTMDWNDASKAIRLRLRNHTPGALLGAVIDFILPKGWMITSMSELGLAGGDFAQIANPGTGGSAESDDGCRSLALALLAARIKARNTSHE